MSGQLLYPLFSLVLLTFAVGISLGIARFRGVYRGQVPAEYFRLLQGQTLPAHLVKLERNFNNLLQMPVLFYACGALAMAVNNTHPWLLPLAWSYVLSRCLHSLIHLTYNHPLHRFLAFLVSSLVLLGMWLILVAGGY